MAPSIVARQRVAFTHGHGADHKRRRGELRSAYRSMGVYRRGAAPARLADFDTTSGTIAHPVPG